MRFVSNGAGLCLGNYRNAKEAIEPAHEVIINGVKRATTPEAYTVTPSMPIQFGQIGLLKPDIDAALAHWKHWPGLPVEGDGVTPVSAIDRIGVWDSIEFQTKYGLTDDERQDVERMLLNDLSYGREYVKVEKVTPPAPWQTYDTTHHSKIAALAEDIGCVTEALTYERATKNRPSVVEALEEKLPDHAPAEAAEEVVLA